MWITIEQIQCLQAVRQFGSFNAASESLGKAKSAVSYSVKKLEEQVGFPLLDRSQYRIQITEQGHAFLDKAKPLLKSLEQLKEEVHKIATGTEMKLRMSASALFPGDRINNVLSQLVLKFPDTEFIFHREILSGEKMLMNDQVDIAVFENMQNTLELEFKKLGSANLMLVIGAGHPFLKIPKKDQNLEILWSYPNIIQRGTIANDYKAGIIEESKKWTVSDIDSKKDLIQNNLGWGRLPGHFIESELKNKKLIHLNHLSSDLEIDFFLCKKKNKDFGPVLKFIWDSF